MPNAPEMHADADLLETISDMRNLQIGDEDLETIVNESAEHVLSKTVPEELRGEVADVFNEALTGLGLPSDLCEKVRKVVLHVGGTLADKPPGGVSDEFLARRSAPPSGDYEI